MLNLKNLKEDLAIRSKNGIPFIFAATVVWSLITVIYVLPFELRLKNLLLFFSTGLMFPLSVLFSNLFKSDWKSETNPLSSIGLVLNLAQLVYYPIVFWAFIKNPSQMVLFFAIIIAAHLFPYGWLYDNKPFTFMSPMMSFTLAVIGWNLSIDKLWYIPLSMVIFLIILNICLYLEYNKKLKATNKISA